MDEPEASKDTSILVIEEMIKQRFDLGEGGKGKGEDEGEGKRK